MLVLYRFCHPNKYVSNDAAGGADWQMSPGNSPQVTINGAGMQRGRCTPGLN